MTAEKARSDEVQVVVEKVGSERFKVTSDQLEDIGSKLRGRPHFSIFNSIILPIIVTVMTLFFTGLFQYISWWNSVSLQNATDIANRASETIEKATAAFDQRRYATFLFISSLRDLVDWKNPDPMVGISPRSPQGSNPLVGAERQVLLDKLQTDLRKERFRGYYEQLKKWNGTIEQLLTDVHYTLDEPIFLQAQGAMEARHEGIGGYYEKLKHINCMQSLTDSLTKLNLNSNSLKLRLAGMTRCFIELNYILARQREGGGDNTETTSKLHSRLDHIYTMGNELRCYALERVDYFIRQKEDSIFSLFTIWKWMKDGYKEEALKHFRQTKNRCSPQNRPT